MLDPNDPTVQELVKNLHQYEAGIAGIRQHLQEAGVNPNQPPSPPSLNPLIVDRHASIPDAAEPITEPPATTRWDPPAPAPAPSGIAAREVLPVDRWTELMFRPGMASAMLYVLLPVIQDAIEAKTPEQASAAIDSMDIWMKMTLSMRVALEDIFHWMESEIGSEDSVIPQALLANMQRASEGYDAGLSEAP